MERPQTDAPLTIGAFVPYAANTAPSQRYRIEQWAPELARQGIEVALEPFADETLTALLRRRGHTLRKATLTLYAFARRIHRTSRLPRGRIVYLHRAACLAGPPFIERRLKRRGHPLIYDFDDAIFLLHFAAANRYLAWLKQPSKTAVLCRLSDRVVVGNTYLAAWALGHSDSVTVIPSSIDTDLYAPPEKREGHFPLVAGWIGSSTSQTYLEAHAPLLRKLLTSLEIELRVISDRRPVLPGVNHTWRPWSAQSEVREIAQFDIGLMPMPNEEWALGKGAFKALQYMAMEVPAVASALGANREVIEHGVNGLLASNETDWIEAVGALARDPELRRRLGREGRRTVESRFSTRASAAGLAGVIRSLARGTGHR